jgi:hypothetical protein
MTRSNEGAIFCVFPLRFRRLPAGPPALHDAAEHIMRYVLGPCQQRFVRREGETTQMIALSDDSSAICAAVYH